MPDWLVMTTTTRTTVNLMDFYAYLTPINHIDCLKLGDSQRGSFGAVGQYLISSVALVYLHVYILNTPNGRETSRVLMHVCDISQTLCCVGAVATE